MNKKNWAFYKSSAQGQKFIALFEKGDDNFERAISILKFAETIGGKNAYKHTEDLYELIDVNVGSYIHVFNEWDFEGFEQFIDSLVISEFWVENDEISFNDESPCIKAEDFRSKLSYTLLWSLALYFYINGAKPLLIPQRFDLLESYSGVLGIDVPAPPRSRDYRDSCLYYFTLCEKWNEFQKENGLTDAEFCACLYDYAPTLIDEVSSEEELPRPTNVWLTGAGKGDFDFLDKYVCDGRTPKRISQVWACSERTRKGDLVVMYCLSPRSYIHSIWKSESGGMYNPFDYYHCRTLLTDGRKTAHITLNDLKGDVYLSRLPIVRRNLQGINGVELPPEAYKNLLRLMEEKGADISVLPKLYEGEPVDFGTIAFEKDVEENILIPALVKLGYTENDWSRQLRVKAGRTEKAIPDFAFFPHGQVHMENAPMIIEAKYDMSSAQEFDKAFRQGLSYARLLRSNVMGICDKHRLVVYRTADGEADKTDPLFESLWDVIYRDDEVGARLNQLIGKVVVEGMK